jgi:plastocyanin
MRRIIVGFGIAAVMVGMAAAGAIAQTYGAPAPQPTPQPAAPTMPAGGTQGPQNVIVTMEDNYFEPANISVPVGTTVTWVQGGDAFTHHDFRSRAMGLGGSCGGIWGLLLGYVQ